ncbi:MAG TPA: diguanylate cyclase [Gammaproteobacteria bacterium]|nr:diguanylate cyclase [Gammaproteobacteria bacterium]
MPPVHSVIPVPQDEAERLAALRRLKILDTGSEEFFDSITQLAAELCGTPISLVTFIDADRQWFKSRVGLNVCETPRDVAFCAHAIHQSEVFVIPDTRGDPRFAANPLVTGDPYIRFYAGAPIMTGSGHRLGTVCVIDRQPRTLSATQKAMLRVLSHDVAAELDRRASIPADQQRRSAAAHWQSKKSFFCEAIALETLYSTAPVGLSFLDTDLRFVHVNERFARIMGRSVATCQGRALSEVLPAMAAELEPLCHDVLHIGKQISELGLDAVPVLERGAARDLQVSLSPLKNPLGEILGISWAIQDITERKRAEKTLRRSREQISLILDRSNDAFIAMDMDGRVTEWNARAEAMFGWTKTEVIGRPMAETIIPPVRRQAHLNGLRRFQATGRAPLLNQRIEVSALHRDGHEFPVLLSVTPIRMDDKWVFSAFLHDVTEHKRRERELKEHQLEFEAANAKRAEFAATDSLTGLKNHASFHHRLNEAYTGAKCHHSPLSVIILDIDHFKQYNDQYGHPAGDKILRTVGRLLLKKARSYDFVARYGGDEFAIILPRTDSHGATIMGDRFRRTIEGTFWRSKAVTVSCGIATMDAATAYAKVLLDQASRALHEAKRQGCDRVIHANMLSRPD